jgi:acetyl-CoA acetyltransferase
MARRLYGKAGLGPNDVDVAQIYDHFTGCVLMQLEDYGFCKRGEGGPFVESGALRGRTAACRPTRTAATCRRRTSTA